MCTNRVGASQPDPRRRARRGRRMVRGLGPVVGARRGGCDGHTDSD